jgi:hypothetical protein
LLHCGLDGDGERSRPAAGILAGNDAIDPRHSERAGDIHGQDLGMGMRRAQDRRMQCVRPNRFVLGTRNGCIRYSPTEIQCDINTATVM